MKELLVFLLLAFLSKFGSSSNSDECALFLNCAECLTADPFCGWCMGENKCSQKSHCDDSSIELLPWLSSESGKCPIITGVVPRMVERNTSRQTGIRSSGATFCPKISRTTSEGNEILVPNGSKKVIKVRAHIVGSFMVQSRFLCSFIIDGRTITVNGQLLGDTIYCDAIEFSTTSTSQKTVVPFAVLVGRSKQLDNPDNIHVVICQPESCDK